MKKVWMTNIKFNYRLARGGGKLVDAAMWQFVNVTMSQFDNKAID